MPQAVAELLDTNDYSRVDEVKRDIIQLYHNDLKKLDTTYNLSTSLIFDAVPSELSSHSRLFKATTLGKNARVSRNYNSFEAIKDSMIVNIANNCSDPNFAFALNKDISCQKIFMGDTGLLTTQILRSKGYELFFHNFDHHEIDFMIPDGKKIIPLEVKSSVYKNHRSLDLFRQKYSKQISKQYVICAKDLKTEDGITFIPFYMAMFL